MRGRVATHGRVTGFAIELLLPDVNSHVTLLTPDAACILGNSTVFFCCSYVISVQGR
jgi:hypothetical protein